MEVIYKKSIREEFLEAKLFASVIGKRIDYIILNEEEMKEVCFDYIPANGEKYPPTPTEFMGININLKEK